MISTNITINCGCGFTAKASDFKSLKDAVGKAVDHAQSLGHTLDLHGGIKADKLAPRFVTEETTYENRKALAS